MIVDTKRFEIQPLHAEALPDVAAFLGRWPGLPDATQSLRRLRWLLLDNPLATATTDHGLCVRDTSGAVVGLLVAFAHAFRAGDGRLLGLCSGNYFVAPQARTLGFYLFKRHLQSSGFDLFFSTSCNAVSGELWAALGAHAVPDSDAKYVLPLNLDVVLSAFLAARASSSLVMGSARVLARCATSIWRSVVPTSSDISVDPCRDWEKLAALADRNRSRRWVTTDRSAAYLEWRYGPGSPNQAADICVFRDTGGNEGWFALGETVRGDRITVRGRALLDATWPRDQMEFGAVLTAIARFAERDTDAIYFRPRRGVDYGELRRFILHRRREPPCAFAAAGKGRSPVAPASLDLVLADGDSGFSDDA